MKNLLFIVIILLSFGITEAQNAKSLTGEWYGSYYCAQGETGLNLTVKGRSNGKIKGTFTFFPIVTNQNAKPGKFSFTGKITKDGIITLTQNEWLKRPGNYIMVDLEGKLSGSKIFEGKITTSGCGEFKVFKL